MPLQLADIIHRSLEGFCASAGLSTSACNELMSAAFGMEAFENPAALTPTGERAIRKAMRTTAATRFEPLGTD